MKLSVEFEFSAAHSLKQSAGDCGRVHGHNYVLIVEVDGLVDEPSGMVIDFEDLDRVVRREVISRVDHRDLNTFLLTPTAEMILVWFWRLLTPHLPGLFGLKLFETRRYAATCHADDLTPTLAYAPGYDGP